MRSGSHVCGRHRRVAATRALLAILLAFAAPSSATSQGVSEPNQLLEAARRRDAGDFAGAVELLRAHLRRNPDDGNASRLLAQTLYWMKDMRGARIAYETAIVEHPDDWTTRLQYGSMLAETGDRRRAREVVAPIRAVPEARARVEALLGAIDYWSGDLSSARRHFLLALEFDATLDDARRQLDEIAAAIAPWTRVSSELRHDDQPMDRFSLSAEAGWHPAPTTKVSAHIETSRLRSNGTLSADVLGGALTFSHYAAAAHLELDAAAGASGRSRGNDVAMTGRLGVGVRLPIHMILRLHGERAPYLYTIASLDTTVMSTTVGGTAALNHPRGWIGEAALQRQIFADDNAIASAYAWLLAPVVARTADSLQLGYALSFQDAEESRFEARTRNVPGVPGVPGGGMVLESGRYEPYYTPIDLVTHALIAAAMVRPSAGVTLRANGSYGVRATEVEPFHYLAAAPGQPVRVERDSRPRELHPWSARASLELRPSGALAIALTGDVLRTAFHSTSSGGVQFTFRFSSTSAAR